MIRFLADEDLNNDILRSLVRRLPHLLRTSGRTAPLASALQVDNVRPSFAPSLELAREHRDHVPLSRGGRPRERVRQSRLNGVVIGHRLATRLYDRRR